MKTKFTAIVLFFFILSVYGQSRGSVSLDVAIDNAARQIQDSRLNQGAKIIVYQFQSLNQGISDYVLNELFDLLVNSNKFEVLTREDADKDAVQAEINFQYFESANMISDDSLASLTRRLGAQAIVTGSLDDAGNEYRFRIRVIGTETMAAIASYTATINKNDQGIKSFLPRSVGEKIGTGAMNIFFGLGSYLEGDIAGGLTITAGYALAAGLFVVEAAAIDWPSPWFLVPARIGIGIAGLTIAYGFLQPFIYNKAPQIAAVMNNFSPGIVLVSDKDTGNSTIGFRIAYTIRF